MKQNKPVTVSLSVSDRIFNLCENLTLIFIALRIAGVIDWPIWQIAMPMILVIVIPLAAGVLLGIGKWLATKTEEPSDD